MEIIGTNDKGLLIDLTNKSYEEFTIKEEERKKFLGAKGLAIKYLAENLDLQCDPLSSSNILAFFTGAMLGTRAPCTARFAAATKSPLTQILVSSSCGGSFGEQLKKAGYDGLLIKGKANSPMYLSITAYGIEFIDANHIWGKDIKETQEMLSGKSTASICIGKAGENKVLYANVASDRRFFGRGGIGAVMGAKNLKAVVAKGLNVKISPKNRKTFQKMRKKALDQINTNQMTSEKYRTYGTNTNVKLCQETKILPVKNFTKGSSPEAKNIYGESFVEEYEQKNASCKYCPILCGHKAKINNEVYHIPEYETTSLIGSNLEIFNKKTISKWNDLCSKLGLDTISTGNILGFVMEATEKGLMNTNLSFGSEDHVADMIIKIANREGIGDDLANGTKWLSEKYGGSDFAIQVKGLEMAGYDPRGAWGQGLSYAVANRGACHLSGVVMTIESFFQMVKGESIRAKPKLVYFMENLNSAINALQMCVFSSMALLMEPFVVKYTPKPILKQFMTFLPSIALKFIDLSTYCKLYQSVTGIKLSPKELLKAGERVHVLERYLNNLMGIRRKDDTLPLRLLKEGRETDLDKYVVPLEKMIDEYYNIRGYDHRGIPTVELMENLDLQDYIKDSPLVPLILDKELRSEMIKPGNKGLKKAIINLVFTVLGRSFKTLSKYDSNIKKEIESWPKNFKILFKVQHFGPSLGLVKTSKNQIKPKNITEQQADLVIYFKNVDSAFMLMTAQIGTHQAYAQHRLRAKGNLLYSMSVIRCLNIAETYLFPSFIARKIIRDLPEIDRPKKYLLRMYLYLLTVPLGL